MKKVIEILRNSKSVVILPHINADGDAVASCQAMRELLCSMGIKSVIIAEEAVEKRLNFIADGVTVYDGQMPVCDTVVVLDCGDKDRLGKRQDIISQDVKVINIDHHRTNRGFGDASFVDADACATGQILFDLFSEAGVDITDDAAMFIYTAIYSDTGGFAYSNVSPKTFTIASELIKHSFDHAEVARLLFNCVDINSELIKAELVKSVNSYSDGKIRTVTATKELAKSFGLDVEDIEDIVDIPRRIRGTEIAVAIKERNDGVKISLRSNGDADVAKVALVFGGGGHTKAAGCNIDATVCEAEKLIVKACEDALL